MLQTGECENEGSAILWKTVTCSTPQGHRVGIRMKPSTFWQQVSFSKYSPAPHAPEMLHQLSEDRPHLLYGLTLLYIRSCK